MIKTISQNVPMCPVCAALMRRRTHDEHVYFVCRDCNSIWAVALGGQAELEVIITDNVNELELAVSRIR